MEPDTNNQPSPVTPESIPIETPQVYHTISGGPTTYKETLKVKYEVTHPNQASTQASPTQPPSTSGSQPATPEVKNWDSYLIKVCYQLYILIALVSTLLPTFLKEDPNLFLTPLYYVFGFCVFILFVLSIKNILQGKGFAMLWQFCIFLVIASVIYFGLIFAIPYLPTLSNLK